MVTIKLHENSNLAFYCLDSEGGQKRGLLGVINICPFKLLNEEIKLTPFLVVSIQLQGYDIKELLQAT
jgi:hypothetical protein